MHCGRYNITITGRLAIALLCLCLAQQAFAAIGCTLSNPAEDLKYLYPAMTSYKEDLQEFGRLTNGKVLFQALRERLAGDLDPIYETYETPYTIYNVFKGAELIGIVHGVNVPGRGGVIQVFLAADPKTGGIVKFFFQRLESSASVALRDKAFRSRFEGLTLGDFYKHDYYQSTGKTEIDAIAKIATPATLDEAGQADYKASLRGIRKNLILLDFFVYGRRFEPFWDKAKASLQKKRK